MSGKAVSLGGHEGDTLTAMAAGSENLENIMFNGSPGYTTLHTSCLSKLNIITHEVVDKAADLDAELLRVRLNACQVECQHA